MANALKKLVADMLLDIVKAYSPTGSEERATKILYEYARSLGFDNINIDSVGNLIAEIGYGKKSIALVGHIDTVPGEIPVEFNGHSVRGRGAVDAKGPLVAMFVGASLAKKVINLDRYRVVAVAVVGEEGDSRGAKELIKNNFKADGIVIGEPSNNSIVLGYRGSMKIEIVCESKPWHTSSPSQEPSACDKIVDIWTKIRNGYSSFNAQSNSAVVLYIGCGKRERYNVYPTQGDLLLDIRVSVDGSIDAVERDIAGIVRNYSKCSYRVIDFTLPIKVSVNNTIVRSLTRALIRSGIKPRFVYKLGTSDMNILYVCTYNNNIVAYGPGRSELSHTDEEEISIDEVVQGAETYMKTVEEFFKIIG